MKNLLIILFILMTSQMCYAKEYCEAVGVDRTIVFEYCPKSVPNDRIAKEIKYEASLYFKRAYNQIQVIVFNDLEKTPKTNSEFMAMPQVNVDKYNVALLAINKKKGFEVNEFWCKKTSKLELCNEFLK